MALGTPLNKILTTDLNDYLYNDEDFITGNALFDSQGSSKHRVEINESQEQPKITENHTVFPLKIHSTEDSNKHYDIDTLRSEPTFIEDVDEILTVFNKRGNELKKHTSSMRVQYLAKIANTWAREDVAADITSGHIIKTTGAASDVLNGDMSGTRKIMTRKDWIRAKARFAKDKVSTKGLVALVDTAMYYNIYEMSEFIQYQLVGKVDPVVGGGAIGELFGIRIFVKNGVPTYNKLYSALNSHLDSDGEVYTPAADDNLAIMIWNPSYVRYSLGNEKVYSEEGSATMQGSIFSTRMRCGGMRSRIDNKGVVMIVQEWVS